MEMGTKRWLYVLLAFMQICFTSGIIYGWPALELMLIEDGFYEDRCEKGAERPCDAQSLYTFMMYTVATFVNNLAAIVNGFVLDRFGPRFTSLISSGIFLGGCALFNAGINNPLAYVVGFALLGFSGPGIYVAVMHLNNLFPGRQATVLSFFSGSFGVSSFVFRWFKLAREYNRELFTLSHEFTMLIIIMFPFLLASFFIWPDKPFQLPKQHREESESLISNKELVAPAKEQLMTLKYWLPVVWISLSNLRVASYMGTINHEFDSFHAEVFFWIWNFGFVGVPFFGTIVDKKGTIWSIFITNLLMFLFCILSLVPLQNIQYLSFVLISTVNVGMWGLFYTYLSQTFGFANYGKLLGVACVAIALIGLIKYPLFTVTLVWLDDNYLYMNILFAALSVPVFYTPYYLWRHSLSTQGIN